MSISGLIIRLRQSSFFCVLRLLVPRCFRKVAWDFVLKNDEFEVMGSRMFIPAWARMQDLVLDSYEPKVSACLRELLQPGMVFCDVGANLGVFTLLAARQVGPTGQVFSFEPVPANFDVLQRNVEINQFRNVTCIPKAVAQCNGVSKLYLSQYCGSHSLIDHPAASSGEVLEIETVRLDSISNLDRIDVLKIDVEGAELEVVKSLGNLRPKIILEYFPERISRSGLDGNAFLKVLRELGYENVTNLDCPDAGLEPLTMNKNIAVNLLCLARNRFETHDSKRE
jgi:FkbM family methyltransferase